jgi:hypothetical protein
MKLEHGRKAFQTWSCAGGAGPRSRKATSLNGQPQTLAPKSRGCHVTARLHKLTAQPELATYACRVRRHAAGRYGTGLAARPTQSPLRPRMVAATGGRIGHHVAGLPPLLLLEHVGARSGKRRTAPLASLSR